MVKVRALHFLLMLIACACTASAQQLLATAGSHAIASDLSVAWSIGEPVIATGSGVNVVATQGFHQPPADLNTIVIPRGETDPTWLLYPNPTRGVLQFSTTEPEAYQAEVINAMGQRIHLWPISTSLGLWSVEDLASGAYHLRVLDRSGNELRTIEFIVSQ